MSVGSGRQGAVSPGGIRSWSVAGVLAGLAGALVFAFALTVLAVALLAYRDPAARSLPDAVPLVIVLGGGMAADGTLGSTTIPRFEAGLALLAEGRAGRIHLSGGDRLAGVTEGALMASMARKRLPGAVVTFEDRSQSTLQNALFSVETLGSVPPGTILVTDPVHLFRAWAAFQWAGARGLLPVPAWPFADIPPAERPRRVLGEAVAVWVNAGRAAAFSLREALGADRAATLPILAGGRG
jgi:uncharacterized SAM-binding protein YcdF (DUF218 family)